jgi:hypothetical protein
MLIAILMNKELIVMWKIKCLNMFNAPPPLFWRGGREVRPERGWGEVSFLYLCPL